jgi:hypothetical protein
MPFLFCARSGFPGMQRRCASNKYGVFVFERGEDNTMFFFYLLFSGKQNEETGREKVC